MNKQERALIEKAKSTLKKAGEYIRSNENWPYYFLSASAGINPELRRLVENYPDDWKDYIELVVEDFSETTVRITIYIDNPDEEATSLRRYINLINFEETDYLH